MEFLDEYESRPRLLIQSKHLPQPSDHESSFQSSSHIHKPTLFVSLSLSIAIFYFAFRYIDLEPQKSLLLWISCSLLLGPFAPPSLTAGDIRVGLGPIVEEIPEEVVDTDEKLNRKSSKPNRKLCEDPVRFDGLFDKSTSVNGFGSSLDSDKEADSRGSLIEERFEEREWSSTDEDVLRKLMGKHPAGQPGRWEVIAKGFKGKHTVESVILKAKEMGVKKASDQDSFEKFLKDRKPVDKRVLDEAGDGGIGMINTNVEDERKVSGWSAGEDLALLNALKAFPKDVPMRWEKIAASLPDKTKSVCMKRVTELKKDFRNSRTSTDKGS